MHERQERVVLVDRDDVEVGTAGKLEAHADGALHRAFSVFLLNGRGEVLLQRRAAGKYHTGGLWSNTCCGHPRPGEAVAAAARRRLREEMGIDCALQRRFGFLYRAELDDGLSEHEYDHVFVGRFDGVPEPDPREVGAWRWASPEALRRELDRTPDVFTPWFSTALDGLFPAATPSRDPAAAG